MAWDLRLDPQTRDLRPGIVTGQDEIVQRVLTRLWRHLGEWFVNTSAGLPWYAGPSCLMAGKLTAEMAILGTRNFRYADLWIRNEIADTQGVIEVVDFNTFFDASTRQYSIRAAIVTEYGQPYLLRMDRVLDARSFVEEAV